MSAAPAEPTTQPDPEPQGDPAAAEVDKPLGENGEKALKAERDARKAAEAASAELQKQLDEINNKNLSDLERAQKAASEAEAIANAAQAEAMRLRIAAKHGISDEDADLFLTGSDQDTLERQATTLASRTSTGATPGPRPDLSQGGTGNPATGDPAQDFANFMAAQRQS